VLSIALNDRRLLVNSHLPRVAAVTVSNPNRSTAQPSKRTRTIQPTHTHTQEYSSAVQCSAVDMNGHTADRAHAHGNGTTTPSQSASSSTRQPLSMISLARERDKVGSTGKLFASFIKSLKSSDRDSNANSATPSPNPSATPSSASSPSSSAALAYTMHTSSPNPAAAASPVSSPIVASTPDRDHQQAALIKATMERRSREKEKEKDTAKVAKEKFLSLFRTDADRAKERAREQAAAEQAESQAKAAAAMAAQAAEPIKLELTPVEPNSAAIVGRPLRAIGHQYTPASAPSASPSSLSLSSSLALSVRMATAGTFRWYRASETQLDEVAQGSTPFYSPSLDDVGCRICCQWIQVDPTATPLSSTDIQLPPLPTQSSFAEIGPIVMDGRILADSLRLFRANRSNHAPTAAGVQVLDLSRNAAPAICTVKRSMMRIAPVQQHTHATEQTQTPPTLTFMLLQSAKQTAAPDGSSTSSSPSIRFLLDSADPLGFTMEDGSKSFHGSIDPWSESVLDADTQQSTPTSTDEANAVSTSGLQLQVKDKAVPPHLIARGQRIRDALACLVRRIVRTGSEVLSEEEQAIVDRMQEAMASSATSSASPLLDVTVEPISLSPSSDSSDIIHVRIAAAPGIHATSDRPAPPTSSLSSNSSGATSASTSLQFSTSATSSSSTTHLTQRLAELQAEKSFFQSTLNDLLLQQRRSEMEYKNGIDSLKSTLSQRDDEVASLRRSLDVRGEEVDSHKLALQKLSAQMTTLANNEIRLSKELKQARNERDDLANKMEQERRRHEQELDAIKEELTQSNEERRMHAEAASSAKTQSQQLEQEVARLSSVEDRLQRSQEAERTLRHDLACLKQELNRMRDVQTRLERLEVENHALRSEREKEKQREKERKRIQQEQTDEQASGEVSARMSASSSMEQLPPPPPSSSALRVTVTPADTPHGEMDSSMEDALELSDVSASPTLLANITSSVSPAHVSSTPIATHTYTPASSSSASHQHATLQPPYTHASYPADTATASPPSHQASQSTLEQLRAECGSLAAQLNALREEHSNTLRQLTHVQEQLAQTRAKSKSHHAELEQLRAAHATLSGEHEESVATINYWRRKCETLSTNLDRMMKEQQLQHQQQQQQPQQSHPTTSASDGSRRASFSSSTYPTMSSSFSSLPSTSPIPPLGIIPSTPQSLEREYRKLAQEVADLRNMNHDAERTLEAYRKTIDRNYQLLKIERDANQALQSRLQSQSRSPSGGSSGSSVGGRLFSRSGSSNAKFQQLQHQFEACRALANSLSEAVQEKDQSIDHYKKCNLLLSKRLYDLERRFESELAADGDLAAGKVSYGRINLEEEIQKEEREKRHDNEKDARENRSEDKQDGHEDGMSSNRHEAPSTKAPPNT